MAIVTFDIELTLLSYVAWTLLSWTLLSWRCIMSETYRTHVSCVF